MLIHVGLLQFGDVAVRRRVNDDTHEDMEITTTAVRKLQVYRDEVSVAWEQLIASPIKPLVPKLRLCPNPRCDSKCHFFHAAVEDPIEQVIHEIWARKVQSLQSRTQPADQAVLFQAFVRVAATAIEEILPFVANGIYFEPRCATTDSDYAVVWIPGATHEAAVHKLKTVSHGLGLVRMKQRYGIRVKEAHEEAVYNQLRPGNNFV